MARTLAAMLLAALAASCGGRASSPALERALGHLIEETPRWPRENRCFSCHHNGDGARTLLAARDAKHDVPVEALSSTVEWLGRPADWDSQKGDPAWSDAALARLQFTATLAMAGRAGMRRDLETRHAAGDAAARLQDADGSFPIEPREALGSPATWGTHLATAMTLISLRVLDARRYEDAIARAEAWLRSAQPQNVHQAAAVIIGNAPFSKIDPRLEELLRPIAEGEASGGGWGPYVNSPPEPFDTAMVLIALANISSAPERRAWIERGRAYLERTQEPDGSWPATTRPPGGESHAQTTSTTAWAAMALLTTE